MLIFDRGFPYSASITQREGPAQPAD